MLHYVTQVCIYILFFKQYSWSQIRFPWVWSSQVRGEYRDVLILWSEEYEEVFTTACAGSMPVIPVLT